MDLQVDIYQCGDKHVHVILRGQAAGKIAFGSFEAFAKFAEICQQYIKRRTPIPRTFLDAFEEKDY
jgi:hypothetical protein